MPWKISVIAQAMPIVGNNQAVKPPKFIPKLAKIINVMKHAVLANAKNVPNLIGNVSPASVLGKIPDCASLTIFLSV